MELFSMNPENLTATLRTALKEATEIEEKIDAYKEKYLVSSSGSLYVTVAIVAIFVLVALIGVFTRSAVAFAFGAVPTAIILGATVYVFKVQVPKHRKNCEEYFKRAVSESMALKTIEPNSQSAKKLEYMLSLLEDGRASTWEDCLDGCKRVLG